MGSDAGSHSSGDKPGVVSSTTDDTALKSSGIQLVSKPKLGGDTPKKHKSKVKVLMNLNEQIKLARIVLKPTYLVLNI